MERRRHRRVPAQVKSLLRANSHEAEGETVDLSLGGADATPSSGPDASPPSPDGGHPTPAPGATLPSSVTAGMVSAGMKSRLPQRAELASRCAAAKKSPTDPAPRWHQGYVFEYRRWLDSLSQAWYDHLVNHRLNPTPDDASQAKRLEEQAQEMNADMLQVWREVLTFLCSGPIQDVTEVNRCAAEWGLRIHARAREKSALISQIWPSRTLQTT